jgi:hypothetical protein
MAQRPATSFAGPRNELCAHAYARTCALLKRKKMYALVQQPAVVRVRASNTGTAIGNGIGDNTLLRMIDDEKQATLADGCNFCDAFESHPPLHAGACDQSNLNRRCCGHGRSASHHASKRMHAFLIVVHLPHHSLIAALIAKKLADLRVVRVHRRQHVGGQHDLTHHKKANESRKRADMQHKTPVMIRAKQRDG